MASEQDKVLKVASGQIGYKEAKNGSNKYGKWFGANFEPWCAMFVVWCFAKAGLAKLVSHNSNAAYLQDDIVNKRGGKWIMKKAYNNATKKKNLTKFKKGDIVTFDFGACDGYRRHIGMIESVSGTNLITIEGNTSKAGSQSNGGFVERKTRSYTLICAVARPAYGTKPSDKLKPLVVDGSFGYLTKTRLQRWLGVIEDGDIGRNTVKALQKKVGATVDGSWGAKTTKALQKFLNKNGAKLDVDGSFGTESVKALQRYLNKVVTK